MLDGLNYPKHASRAYAAGPGFTLFHELDLVDDEPRFHDDFVLMVQLSGCRELKTATTSRAVGAGETVLLNPRQVFSTQALRNRMGERDRAIFLQLSPELVSRVATAMASRAEVPRFVELLAQSPFVHQQVCELWTLTKQEVPAAVLERRAAAIASHVLERFSNLRRPALLPSLRVCHRKIARALSHVEAREGEHLATLDLDELAQAAGLSKFHFARQFARVVGMPPGAYLRNLRLSRASEQLRARKATIDVIARDVGFSGNPAFSRAFSRRMGITPRDYQKLWRHLEPRREAAKRQTMRAANDWRFERPGQNTLTSPAEAGVSSSPTSSTAP